MFSLVLPVSEGRRRIRIMPPDCPRCGCARSAELANARIRELLASARGRGLTAVERAEYERLRGVWVAAVLAA